MVEQSEVVLVKTFGNNSNILFQNLHLEAFCREHNIRFINPFLRKYLEIFPLLKKGPHAMARYTSLELFIRRINATSLDDSVPLDEFRTRVLTKRQKQVWVKGWGFRSFVEVAHQRLYFQEIFKPVCSDHIRREHDRLRSKGELLAVHVRRGDYRRWHNGRYFYVDDVYVNQIRKALNSRPNIAIIQIFSNESLDTAPYEALGIRVRFPRGAWYEDQWRMAQSDLILGPPSTFSAWASFMGGVPLWHVMTPEAPATFEICNG